MDEEEQLRQKEGELRQAVEEMFGQGEKAVPWAGAAARIATSSIKARQKAVEGLAYCFLPLQQMKTGFPIHINGFFDLNSSRDNLTSDSGQTGKDSIRAKWNKLIVRHVVSRACANLIAGLVEDIGEDKPKEFYELWPINSAIHPVFKELPSHLIKILSGIKVIRSTGLSKWLEPSKVYTLPSDWQDLMEPLSADGVSFPNPMPPEPIVSAFAGSHLGLYTIQPRSIRDDLIECVRKKLDEDGFLDIPLAQAPKPSLRKREWIVKLLQFCISKGDNDLRGLPLAILANGSLQAFGYNRPGFIYVADTEAMQIFANHPEWFLHPELSQQLPELSRRTWQGLSKMTATEVAERLVDAIGSTPLGEIEWQPDAPNLPNAKWLALVYHYFAKTKGDDLPREKLKKVPLVPGNDGKLYKGGYTNTPLWCGSTVEGQTRETMRYFQISLVEAPTPVLEAITQFVKRHPNKLIWSLTVPDAIDTLAKKILPSLEIEHYERLVNFLSSDHQWLNNAGNKNQDRQNKLRWLRIYPTTSNQIVSLNDENVYMAGGYTPPKLAGSLNLLSLGTNQKWKPLFQLLNIPVLDRATLIRKFLLPGYSKLDEQEHLSALEWIRDNLDTAQKELQKKGEHPTLLKDMSKAPLVRCTNGELRAASLIYDPDSKVVREVIGNELLIPDKNFYSRHWENWLKFFRKLGILTVPSAEDIYKRITLLIEEFHSSPDTVAQACVVIFNHITEHWDNFKNARVRKGHMTMTLSKALKSLEWLPVKRSEEELKQYPGAKIPHQQLYRAEDVEFVQNAHLVASQKPLFREGKQLGGEIKKALGFPTQVETQVVVKHFKCLIKLWESDAKTSINSDNFQKSINAIYHYLYHTFIKGKSRHNEVDLREIKQSFKDSKCLWDGSNFWNPKHAFKTDVTFLGERRVKINPDNPQIRAVYEFLGQKRAPDVDDYLIFLNELAQKYGNQALNKEDENCVLQLLFRLTNELSQNQDNPKKLNILLLTQDKNLLPASEIFIPDAPWRLPYVQNMIKILHERVSQELAEAAGSRSLFRDIQEIPARQVQISGNHEANEHCRRWQQTLRSPEFTKGLKRLICHEHGKTKPINLDWLAQAEVRAASEIQMDLNLDGRFVASVPGRCCFERENTSFYLLCDDARTMLRNLVETLNNELKKIGCELQDKVSDLKDIIDEQPSIIRSLLDKWQIISLPDEPLTIISLARDEIADKSKMDEIFDKDVIAQKESDLTIDESAEDRVIRKEITEQITAKSTEDSQLSERAGEHCQQTTHPSSDKVDNRYQPTTQHPPKIPKELSQPLSKSPSGSSGERHERTTQHSSASQQTRSSTHRARTSQSRVRTVVYTQPESVGEPDPAKQELAAERKNISNAGIERVIQYEREQGRQPEQMDHHNPGYDIESKNQFGQIERYIEVKSCRGNWRETGVNVTDAQFKKAQELGNQYWLYVVELAESEDYQIIRIQNPANQVKEFRYDDGWRDLAQKELG